MVTKASAHKSTRDAQAMRMRILESLGRMIVRDGLAAIGVNRLAREAGCDKVLLYRYFGDLEGVYEAFAAKSDFWWTVQEITDGIDPRKDALASAGKRILRRHALAIRSRPVTLAVLAAEPVERTPLVVALESVREKRSVELLKWIAERYAVPPEVDLAAVSLLLSSATTYIAMRARTIRVMNGVAIKTDKDWERLLQAVDGLVDRLF